MQTVDTAGIRSERAQEQDPVPRQSSRDSYPTPPENSATTTIRFSA